MANKIPASKQLRDTLAKQEAILEGINTFKPGSNEYGATNAEVTANTNGTPTDIAQRNTLTTMNEFNAAHPYTSPE